MDPCASKDLEVWKDNVSNLNSRTFLNTVGKPSRIVYSDVSATGCAGFIAIDDTINWDSLQMNQSLSGENSPRQFCSENQAVPSIVHSGSMKDHLHILALDRTQTAKDNTTDVEVEWIPRTQNERTDYSSKIFDYDDCTVKD